MPSLFTLRLYANLIYPAFPLDSVIGIRHSVSIRVVFDWNLAAISYNGPARENAMITAFMTGLLLSFLGSMIPTGPIALIIIRNGMHRKQLSAISIAFGAALAEAAYASVAYLGISFALSRYPLGTSVLRLVSSALLIAFAIVWSAGDHTLKPLAQSRERVGSNFLLGLSVAGLNPTFLATWAGTVAIARGAGLMLDAHAVPAFAVGVASGPVLWFYILLRIICRHAESLGPERLRIVEKVLPAGLLLMAGVILAQALIPLLK